ncbi:hypothetical protein [Pedobacter sp. L105]|uniref:hypothetical protein n=1 Tax=Pedobacter sp. L105 TaxID=1641871 RepID=UPI00131C7CC1|nr:hypothetical protein [Pedobacter sp. L105]
MKNQFLKLAGKLILTAVVMVSLSASGFANTPQQEKEKMANIKQDKMDNKKMSKMEKSKMSKKMAVPMKKSKIDKSKMSEEKMTKGKM